MKIMKTMELNNKVIDRVVESFFDEENDWWLCSKGGIKLLIENFLLNEVLHSDYYKKYYDIDILKEHFPVLRKAIFKDIVERKKEFKEEDLEKLKDRKSIIKHLYELDDIITLSDKEILDLILKNGNKR